RGARAVRGGVPAGGARRGAGGGGGRGGETGAGAAATATRDTGRLTAARGTGAPPPLRERVRPVVPRSGGDAARARPRRSPLGRSADAPPAAPPAAPPRGERARRPRHLSCRRSR